MLKWYKNNSGYYTPGKWLLNCSIILGLLSSCSEENNLSLQEEPNPVTGGFVWTKAADVATRNTFLRNFGVGYSYNAVRGSYCDWSDIRCQIVNRGAVEELMEQTGELLLVNTGFESVTTTSKYNYSLHDYVAAVELNLHEEVDLGLYNKEKRKRQYFLEDGIQEEFYYTLNEQITLVDSYIADGSILAYYDEYKSLLTNSFINAVNHLAESDEDNYASVDSFINVYGTHVIVEAMLGGKICIDLLNDLWRYNDKAKEEEWTSEEFLGAVQGKDEHRSGKDEFQWVEHGRLNITAYGGDQSTLTGLLGEHAPDGTRTFSTDGISAWRKSLYYNPQDELHSNVEMVDMRLRPIWEFAEVVNPQVADRIKMAVLQDAALQQKLLGERNFFDASFPIRYTKSSCLWRQSTNDWQTKTRTDSESDPIVVNIVSGGRYVATVCHEVINDKNLWVCYPIFEGKVKLPCGIGVADDNTTYQVCWLNGKASLTRQEDVAGDTFYITGGTIGLKAQDEIEYADSYAIPYIELSGGIQSDGSYASTAYDVSKQGAEFILTVHGDTQLKDIVGWTYDSSPSQDVQCYKRDVSYVYIYNPNEIKYE